MFPGFQSAKKKMIINAKSKSLYLWLVFHSVGQIRLVGRKKMCFISNVKDSDLKLLRKHTPLDYKRNVSVFQTRHRFGN